MRSPTLGVKIKKHAFLLVMMSAVLALFQVSAFALTNAQREKIESALNLIDQAAETDSQKQVRDFLRQYLRDDKIIIVLPELQATSQPTSQPSLDPSFERAYENARRSFANGVDARMDKNLQVIFVSERLLLGPVDTLADVIFHEGSHGIDRLNPRFRYPRIDMPKNASQEQRTVIEALNKKIGESISQYVLGLAEAYAFNAQGDLIENLLKISSLTDEQRARLKARLKWTRQMRDSQIAKFHQADQALKDCIRDMGKFSSHQAARLRALMRSLFGDALGAGLM